MDTQQESPLRRFMVSEDTVPLETPKQEKQYIPNPSTGEMMELNTYSGKELFWRETNEENEDL